MQTMRWSVWAATVMLLLGAATAVAGERPRGEGRGGPRRGGPGAEGGRGGLNLMQPENFEGPSKGVTTGVVMMARNAMIIVTDETQTRHIFVPRWTGNAPKDGGGYDKAVLAAMNGLRQGDTVKVEWVFEERQRALSIEIVKRADPNAPALRGGDRERPAAERDRPERGATPPPPTQPAPPAPDPVDDLDSDE